MSTPDLGFPNTPADLTAGWMSEALSASFPGTQVKAVHTLEEHSGTTGRVRLGLAYEAGRSGPESVFVKLPPFEESQRRLVAMTDMGRSEAHFYTSLAAEVPIRIPRAFHAAFGAEPTDYVMVLEDLQASGVTFPARPDEQAEHHGAGVIEALARLHAHFWNDPRFTAELAWVKPLAGGKLGAQLILSALEQFGADFPPVFTDLAKLFAEHWKSIPAIWARGEQTLIHGDTHGGNQFTDGAAVGFYDWAVIGRAPGIRDIAIFLGNSCAPEVRRQNEKEWIELYRQTLLESGVDAPTFDELWLRYRLGVLYSWVAATTTAAMGSTWQPIEIGRRAMTVATAACSDLETVEAFREALDEQ